MQAVGLGPTRIPEARRSVLAEDQGVGVGLKLDVQAELSAWIMIIVGKVRPPSRGAAR